MDTNTTAMSTMGILTLVLVALTLLFEWLTQGEDKHYPASTGLWLQSTVLGAMAGVVTTYIAGQGDLIMSGLFGGAAGFVGVLPQAVVMLGWVALRMKLRLFESWSWRRWQLRTDVLSFGLTGGLIVAGMLLHAIYRPEPELSLGKEHLWSGVVIALGVGLASSVMSYPILRRVL